MKKLRQLTSSHIASNVSTAENTRLVVGAINDAPLSGGEWEQVTPWGNFPNEKGLQRVTPKEGQAMVTAFNSLAGRLKNAFMGIPVYIGHPDVDPETYKDQRRIGKIVNLKVGANGLYCQVAWNDVGEQNLAQGYWVYPSPVWRFKKVGGGVIEPFELRSVGLVNTPNIQDAKPWAKNEESGPAGPLAEYAKRRAAGCRGAGNLRAVRARAVMRDKREEALFSAYPVSRSSGSGHQVHIHIGGGAGVASLPRNRPRHAKNDGPSIAQEIKDQKRREEGLAAGKALLQKAKEFEGQGHSTHMAFLKARKALPESAATFDNHTASLDEARDVEARKEARIAFAKIVKEIQDKDPRLSYREAWLKAKKMQPETSE